MTANKLGMIKQEAAKCRKAFKGVKIGALTWCCHHDIEVEILVEFPEERIKFVLVDKPKEQRSLRLHEFRPVKNIPDWLNAALAKWDAALAKWDAALAKRNAAWAKRNAAWVKWNAVIKEHTKELTVLHKQEVPDTTWNGKTIGF